MTARLSIDQTSQAPVQIVPAFADRLSGIAPLPWSPTPLIDREQDTHAVAALLRADYVRLLTLTGPGGVGKSRLALRVAAELSGDFPDGIAFVPLSAVSDPGRVLPAITQALGVREMGGRALDERLTAAIGHARVLLLLDNFEQVVAAGQSLAGLLGDCPGLKVLVTSRVSLRIGGEQEYEVPPLGLPATGGGAVPEFADLSANPAVALFVQRTSSVRASFELHPGNAVAVAEICRRLDGLPLAIELAAARGKVLSPPALLARLDHGLQILAGGPTDQPARLQTMRDAITWSYRLLDEPAKALLGRLAVFAGGFTLDAAEAITTDGGGDVLEGLSALVDSSLLRQADGPDGQPRFAMLETIREFGLELLALSGEEYEVRRRHATWCLAIGEAAWTDSITHVNVQAMLDRLESELGNIRAAMAWLEAHAPADALRLSGAIFWFCYVRGHLEEGSTWLERGLARADSAPVADRARALLGAGLLASYLGNAHQATTWLDESRSLYLELGDDWGISFALAVLGVVAEDTGDYDLATERFHASSALSQATNDLHNVAHSHLHLGIVNWGKGALQEAETSLLDALRMQRDDGGNAYGVADSLAYLGLVAQDQGDVARSLALQRESLVMHLTIGAIEDIAFNLGNLAMIALAGGQTPLGVRLLGKATAMREEIGNPFKLPERAVYNRGIEAARNALGGAAFDAEWAAGAGRPVAAAVADAETIPAPDALPVAPVQQPEWTRVGLTEREFDVLPLLVAGYTDRQIADRLFISHRTAQGHVSSIFGKLGVSTRTAAATAAIRLGLVAEIPPAQ